MGIAALVNINYADLKRAVKGAGSVKKTQLQTFHGIGRIIKAPLQSGEIFSGYVDPAILKAGKITVNHINHSALNAGHISGKFVDQSPVDACDVFVHTINEIDSYSGD
eukprot:TRINITY_DN19444_c0_g1_i1.p2 TRINITY_DN19444_c0_g1~~TRINITY_DN19444_c0_g1_i1.p2  ORF type:complete len:108 (+),score=7.50 TRINITY_DN19444_c0_g1_i1:51-374(+)